jgi:hypothetical protein
VVRFVSDMAGTTVDKVAESMTRSGVASGAERNMPLIDGKTTTGWPFDPSTSSSNDAVDWDPGEPEALRAAHRIIRRDRTGACVQDDVDPMNVSGLVFLGSLAYTFFRRNSELFPRTAFLSTALVLIVAALACLTSESGFANCFFPFALLPLMVSAGIVHMNHQLRSNRELHDPHWRRACSALGASHTHRGHKIEGTYAGFPLQARALSIVYPGQYAGSTHLYELVLRVGSHGTGWRARSVRGRAHTRSWKVTARDQGLKKRLVEGGVARVLRDAEDALDLEHCPVIVFLPKEGELVYTDNSAAVPSKEAFRSHLDLLVRVEGINREVNAS